MLQHVTDPETCIQCSACEMACPLGAIQNVVGRFCIDAAICNECRKCADECPTGAADTYILVEEIYSIDEQAAWTALPSVVVSRDGVAAEQDVRR